MGAVRAVHGQNRHSTAVQHRVRALAGAGGGGNEAQVGRHMRRYVLWLLKLQSSSAAQLHAICCCGATWVPTQAVGRKGTYLM
jgi:hypothetical protein